jgi:hypothetical protein
MSKPAWPYIERYGYTWIQHPDGLYYGPPFPGEDDQLIWLEKRGARWGMAPCDVGSIGISCVFPRWTPHAHRPTSRRFP